MTKQKMTLREVCEDMRSRGFKIKESTLSDCLAAGVFPFGTLINTGRSGRRTYMILRHNYEAWAAENIGPANT